MKLQRIIEDRVGELVLASIRADELAGTGIVLAKSYEFGEFEPATTPDGEEPQAPSLVAHVQAFPEIEEIQGTGIWEVAVTITLRETRGSAWLAVEPITDRLTHEAIYALAGGNLHIVPGSVIFDQPVSATIVSGYRDILFSFRLSAGVLN